VRYRVSGEGWQRIFTAHIAPLGREWRIADPDGVEWSLRVRELEEGVLRIELLDETHTITVLPGNRAGEPVRFLLDDRRVELRVEDEIDLLQEVLGDAGVEGGRRDVRSVMPGIIRAALVAEGDTVAVDQPILVLEAMKMENEIRSPVAGRVSRLAVKPGETVAAGALLAVIEQ
jgi:pyruvate carboxylase subunit B